MTTVLLDPGAIERSLRRMATEIVERSGGGKDLVLVGVRRGGVPLAERLADAIAEAAGTRPPVGAVDITLYRDDAATALPNPRIGPSHIPFGVDGKRLVLVDDVVSTGRTTRAAVDAVLDYGRPARIELAVLVDRGGRELPIAPDYVGKHADVDGSRRVEVVYRTEEGAVGSASTGALPYAEIVEQGTTEGAR